MEVVVQPNADAAAGLVAREIGRALRENPRLVLGLATGRTMDLVYGLLVRMYREEGLDFSSCRTFNLDEYVGLPASHPNSYRHYMNHHLFLQVNINMRNTHLPDGEAEDFKTECANYEKLIVESGGIDLQLLGIGINGHLGFNEPLSAFNSRTHVKVLSRVTREQNALLFGRPEDVPRRAITMGVRTILDCRRCLLLATGEDKAEIVAKAVEGPITSMISATALQLHPECAVVLDEVAAAGLKHLDDYRWMSENHHERQLFGGMTPAIVPDRLQTNGQAGEQSVKRAVKPARQGK